MNTRHPTHWPSMAATSATVLGLMVALLLGHAWVWADRGQRHTPADQFPSDVASTWFEALYDVVKAEKTPPPPASRIYGITAVALFEAIVAGTEEHRSLVRQLNDLRLVPQPKKHQKYHWPTVANPVLAHTIRSLYPTISPASLDAINTLEHRFASHYVAELPRREYDAPSHMARRSPRRSSSGPPPTGSRSTTTAGTSRCRCRVPGSRRRPPSTRTPCSHAGA